MEKQFVELESELKKAMNTLQTIESIGDENGSFISKNEILLSKVIEENTLLLEKYQSRSIENSQLRITELEDILFNNFDIMNIHLDIIRTYVNENYQRILKLKSSMITIANTLSSKKES